VQQGVHAAKAQRGVVTVESVEELVMKVSAQLMAEENGRGKVEAESACPARGLYALRSLVNGLSGPDPKNSIDSKNSIKGHLTSAILTSTKQMSSAHRR
jgi:hypothetical protein